jgi:hypothetical protein
VIPETGIVPGKPSLPGTVMLCQKIKQGRIPIRPCRGLTDIHRWPMNAV